MEAVHLNDENMESSEPQKERAAKTNGKTPTPTPEEKQEGQELNGGDNSQKQTTSDIRQCRKTSSFSRDYRDLPSDQEMDPYDSDSEDEYKPPEPKSARGKTPNKTKTPNPKTPNTKTPNPKTPNSKTKSSPQKNRKTPKVPASKGKKSQPLNDIEVEIPIGLSEVYIPADKPYMPIKIASVTSLKNVKAATSTPSQKQKTPSKTAKPIPHVKKQIVPPMYSLLSRFTSAGSEVSTNLRANLDEFVAQTNDSPKNVTAAIAATKELLKNLDSANRDLSTVKKSFTKEFVKLLDEHKSRNLIENDPVLKFLLNDSSSAASSQSVIELEDNSDCEIVDETSSAPVSPNVYDTLRKMERQGITWNHSKALTPTHRLINAVANSRQPVMFGKDVVVKKVSKNPNCFFWMDGRNIKPPEAEENNYYLVILNDVTDYVDVPDDTDDQSDIRVYVCEYLRKLVPVSDERSDDSEGSSSSVVHNPKRLSELCASLVCDMRRNCDKKDTSFTLVNSDSLRSSPASLFVSCLDVLFGNDKNDFGCDKKLMRFRRHFLKIRQLSYHTMCSVEGHLKNFFGHLSLSLCEDPNDLLQVIYEKQSDSDDSSIDLSSEYSNCSQRNNEDTEHDILTEMKKKENILARESMLNDSSESDLDSVRSDSSKTSKTRGKKKTPRKTGKTGKAATFAENWRESRPSKNRSLQYGSDDYIDENEDRRTSSECTNDNLHHDNEEKCNNFSDSDNSNNTIVSVSVDDLGLDGISSFNSSIDGTPKKYLYVTNQIKRKNIRKIIDDTSLNEKTKIATREEEERLKRLIVKDEERDNYLEQFAGNKKAISDLILDYDTTTNETISVHPTITKVLKTHQKDGIKFMWDSCFETIEYTNNPHLGSGCIIAHCMGLGKTLQVIALIHTLLTSNALTTKTILVCCPLTTVLNWVDEFHKWLYNIKTCKKINIYDLMRFQRNKERQAILQEWQRSGGVFIMGYEMFRHLANVTDKADNDANFTDAMQKMLLNPGPDLVVCDEGHILKNDNTLLAIALNRIRTKRRIILTGTPLQNNLKEYYCMVNFVKPNLLGSYKEYTNRFVNPITNGQHRDSSSYDIRVMKKRSHVLHKMLEGCVQRKEASILYEYLPAKKEYVLLIPLSYEQATLYQLYLDKIKDLQRCGKALLKDFNGFRKIWTFPNMNIIEKVSIGENYSDSIINEIYKLEINDAYNISHKMIVVFSILNECIKVGDKLVIFCTALYNLDVIEHFLKKDYQWKQGSDYYRMDGSVSMINRRKMCLRFNSSQNTTTKLFLISTKTGGFGINMIGANRAIIMDVSWNPTHDIQSIFRLYRFGQKKNCYIYRLVAQGTMEEKIYERSVTKEATACRVIDEQQIDRHYSMSELHELYYFKHLPSEQQPVWLLPSDQVLVTVLSRLKESQSDLPIVWSIHQHDSLLRDLQEEQLNDIERQEAWTEYEAEKLNNIVQIQNSAMWTANISNTPPAYPNQVFSQSLVHQLSGSSVTSHFPAYNSYNATSIPTPSTSTSTICQRVGNENSLYKSSSLQRTKERHYRPYKSPMKNSGKSLLYNMNNVKKFIYKPNVAVLNSSDRNKETNKEILLSSESSNSEIILDLTNLPDTPESKRKHRNEKRALSAHNLDPNRSVTREKGLKRKRSGHEKETNVNSEDNNKAKKALNFDIIYVPDSEGI